jgi:hypothetical protein
MFNSPVLNVVIGLVFVYLLYSLLATIIKEIIASMFSLRANMLVVAVERMLSDDPPKGLISRFFSIRLGLGSKRDPKALVQKFFSNPGIKYLAKGKLNSKPSYIEPAIFSKAIMDVLKGDNPPAGVNTVVQINSVIADSKEIVIPEQTKKYLKSLVTDSNNDPDILKALLEQWFNTTMDRASGWYKRQAQVILLCIGLMVAIILNVDTLGIVSKLSKDKNAADRLATMATAYVSNAASKGRLDSLMRGDTNSLSDKQLNQIYKENKKDMNDANQVLALGWDFSKPDNCFIGNLWNGLCDSKHPWRKFFGFLITGLAISLGAPFWFDMLSKIINLRSTGGKPDDPAPPTTSGSSPQTNNTVRVG